MSEKLCIMVESDHKKTPEYVFVGMLCEKCLKKDNYEILCIGGYGNLKPKNPKDDTEEQAKKRKVRNALQTYSKFLILFDANSDIEKRKTDIRSWMKNYEVIIKKQLDYEIFLFPDNTLCGNFETLLERITNDAHNSKIFCCLKKMQECLKDENYPYYAPDLKGRMYVYITCLTGNKKENIEKIKKGNYFFDNSEYWDLCHPDIQKLQDFLKTYSV